MPKYSVRITREVSAYEHTNICIEASSYAEAVKQKATIMETAEEGGFDDKRWESGDSIETISGSCDVIIFPNEGEEA